MKTQDPQETGPGTEAPAVSRLYMREPGWQVTIKVGSEREFCYMTSPGSEEYHRLMDGEIYVFSPEEKLCLACAGRRGLLETRPRVLREPVAGLDRSEPEAEVPYDLGPPRA